MSTDKSERKPSQAKLESNRQGKPSQPQAQHRPGNHKPLPFDDAGGVEDVVETTDPQKPPIGIDF